MDGFSRKGRIPCRRQSQTRHQTQPSSPLPSAESGEREGVEEGGVKEGGVQEGGGAGKREKGAGRRGRWKKVSGVEGK